MEQRGKAGQQIQPCQHHVNGQTAVQTLADLLKLLAQILYQCLTAGFIRRQQIGKIERQDQAVERLARARLHQPAQPVFAQAAVEQIIPAGRVSTPSTSKITAWLPTRGVISGWYSVPRMLSGV